MKSIMLDPTFLCKYRKVQDGSMDIFTRWCYNPTRLYILEVPSPFLRIHRVLTLDNPLTEPWQLYNLT